MASSEIVNLILQTAAESMLYLLPVIGIMSGVVFIIGFLFEVTIGSSRKIFRR